MREKILSVEDLSNAIGVNANNLRTYLCNYRLSKYVSKEFVNGRFKLAVKFNKRCAYRLCDFFNKYERNDIVENIEKYCEELEHECK